MTGKPAAVHARLRRAETVGRKVERGGEAGQLLAPPGGQLVQHLSVEPAALPDREVRVVDRRLRQRRLAAAGQGVESAASSAQAIWKEIQSVTR